MSHIAPDIDYQPDPLTDHRLYSGVRTRRFMAFLIDVTIVAVLTFMAGIVVFFIGLATLGLGWAIYAILWPLMALLYCAFTLGGPKSATVGMRAFGLEMRQVDGGRMSPGLAAVHSVLFYASVSILTPFIVLVALFTDRKRLLHDLLLGTVVINRR
ncbi:RDD family protein [Methylobrevis pamukkalensis]|uniref:RDD family protein n=1 Tax=Methylobrevis pamukkalensis TaxID=1439726 RepID=A0A1E3H816_9HYPH|nr:RDD family protein [Methylobrevis pamukkalensis]ODN72460.1 RDD family protein [Methylobrevis pamukkalensis]